MDEPSEAPAFFADVLLDQIIDTITAGRREYRLNTLFYQSLSTVDAIAYRQEVLRDFERSQLRKEIDAFAQAMRTMRHHLTQADQLYYHYQKEAWFVDAVAVYCDAVEHLLEQLAEIDFDARGLVAFYEYLAHYVHSEDFTALAAETRQIKSELFSIRYGLRIKGNRVEVFSTEEKPDYSADVAATFAKFSLGPTPRTETKRVMVSEMSPVEARILDGVAQLNPGVFAHLDAYHAAHQDYLDRVIGRFDREAQFYLAVLDYVAMFEQASLPFCYPVVSAANRDMAIVDGFDAALAYKCITERTPVVSNDVDVTDPERILVVSGPNQGGKTTFARMLGQIHYLASLGCPVPGRTARVGIVDRIFTHFEREESVENLRGKLQDDLIRMHQILAEATPSSLIILNEIFTSTTLQDAVFLSHKILQRIIERDARCVWITFIDELASYSEQTVSLVSTVLTEDPATRTYKVVRRPADGLSYALTLAEKYRVTYHWLQERLS